MSRLEAISEIVQVPMKFIHVVRNPFDNISTMTLRKANQRGAARKEGFKVSCFFSLLNACDEEKKVIISAYLKGFGEERLAGTPLLMFFFSTTCLALNFCIDRIAYYYSTGCRVLCWNVIEFCH